MAGTVTPDQGAVFTEAQVQQLQNIVQNIVQNSLQPFRDEMREDMRGLRDEMHEEMQSLKFRLDNNATAQRNELLLETKPAALECRKKQVCQLLLFSLLYDFETYMA